MSKEQRIPRTYASTAQHQWGSLSRLQLDKIGISKSSVHRLRQSGLIERVQPSVYRITGGAGTWLGKQHEAVLWGGPLTVASHRSAARLNGLGLDWDGTEITIPQRTRRPAPDLVVHYGEISPSDVTEINGLPTMKAARVFLTLGSVLRPAVMESLLDEALRKQIVTISELIDVLMREARRGVRGLAVFRPLLAERAGWVLESALERLMWRTIKSSDLPLPEREVWITTDYRVDFAYLEEKLIIEADGHAYHSSPSDLRKDKERQNVLINLGWRVLRFTWHDLKERPA